MCDREALFRVIRNIVAMNRDGVGVLSPFEYEGKMMKEELSYDYGVEKKFLIRKTVPDFQPQASPVSSPPVIEANFDIKSKKN